MSALNLDVKKDRSLIGERDGLIDRWGVCAIFSAAERFKRSSVQIKADDIIDAFIEVTVEGGIFGERDELNRRDLGRCSKARVSSDYA
jgi:hypothetical protein